MSPRGLWLVLCLLGCSKGPERPGIPPRHVVLVTVDGLRADHLSCFQYMRPTTVTRRASHGLRELGVSRGIDELAQDGVLLANAFAPSGTPEHSLAALHCGASPRATGAADGRIAEGAKTLAEAFAAEGFETRAFVSGEAAEQLGLGRGFAEFSTFATDREAVLGLRTWVDEFDFGADRPLLLWLHLSEPTLPFDPRRYLSQPGFEMVGDFVDLTYTGPVRGSHEYVESLRGVEELSAEQRRTLTDLYDAEVAIAGLFVEYVLGFYQFAGEKSGAWERTCFVLAGTSGMELGEEAGRFGSRGALTEAALHVPLIFRHTDSLTGSRILTDVVQLEDVAPTLCDWFGVDVPATAEGRSLLPLFDSYVERPFEQRPALGFAEDGATLRTPDWRLCVEGEEARLYDLSQAYLSRLAPDVADGHPDVVAELRARLREALERR